MKEMPVFIHIGTVVPADTFECGIADGNILRCVHRVPLGLPTQCRVSFPSALQSDASVVSSVPISQGQTARFASGMNILGETGIFRQLPKNFSAGAHKDFPPITGA